MTAPVFELFLHAEVSWTSCSESSELRSLGTQEPQDMMRAKELPASLLA